LVKAPHRQRRDTRPGENVRVLRYRSVLNDFSDLVFRPLLGGGDRSLYVTGDLVHRDWHLNLTWGMGAPNVGVRRATGNPEHLATTNKEFASCPIALSIRQQFRHLAKLAEIDAVLMHEH
jgi:hypothetical protein